MHQYFAYLSEKLFNEKIDKGLYNLDDLTEIKIPVNMPTITEWRNYQDVSGQIQFDKICYNYVKMKVTRDVLYLMCIPNYKTTHLNVANVINAKPIKGVAVPKKEHVPFGKTIVSLKFSISMSGCTFPCFSKMMPVKNMQQIQRVTSRFISIPDQPPRLSC